ncbi:hypothetical protein FRACYDRAFT_251651 [Fragilariopsis cylindrus CCMP1102]|uniref:Uncharacterized protein n=1 Tax=Fragilariopsis cylindrus CCMP1102 TaxID=635003 RepID=A0A1E7EMJ4_9STRA|nr:hypothetical protein FRACYDRAFT_251651 [Fragilariopsis cylindrus CCMP1102]|eukprot:OEU07150.1 hypothetical protein FRACYDRAFT_251651 [Fragilariopsis cylindrus CCMP1102]
MYVEYFNHGSGSIVALRFAMSLEVVGWLYALFAACCISCMHHAVVATDSIDWFLDILYQLHCVAICSIVFVWEEYYFNHVVMPPIFPWSEMLSSYNKVVYITGTSTPGSCCTGLCLFLLIRQYETSICIADYFRSLNLPQLSDATAVEHDVGGSILPCVKFEFIWSKYSAGPSIKTKSRVVSIIVILVNAIIFTVIGILGEDLLSTGNKTQGFA